MFDAFQKRSGRSAAIFGGQRTHSSSFARNLKSLLLLLSFAWACGSEAAAVTIPPAPREFRGIWIATVGNIDWPSKAGLPPRQMKQELKAIFERAEQLKMNAIIFQVRPAADALYKSDLEPWSAYLTGKQGKPPATDFDPLEFAVKEAKDRGMELHAWFNPYRAGVGTTVSEVLAPNHMAVRRPDLVYKYGTYLWMDPGKEEVQDHTVEVILDVVRRYDIDAVHFDDYFYPYIAKDSSGKQIPFPDDATYAEYRSTGGSLSKERWREENVNTLVRRLSKEIKEIKPHVKFGVSPFGIWRPGYPAGVVGLDSVKELHADSRLWWRQGWIDYLVPQLYWKLSTPGHSYEQLLVWWASENVHHRHLYAGNGAHRLRGADAWTADEIVNQVAYTQELPGAAGNVFFSAKAFMGDSSNIVTALQSGPYIGDALPPAAPWIDNESPAVPKVQTAPGNKPNVVTVQWAPSGEEKPFVWAIYAFVNNAWRMEVVPGSQSSLKIAGTDGKPPALVAVSAVDRCGNESDRALVRLDPTLEPSTPPAPTPGLAAEPLSPADDSTLPEPPVPNQSSTPTLSEALVSTGTSLPAPSPRSGATATTRAKSNLPVLFSPTSSEGVRLPTTPTPYPASAPQQ